MLYELIFEGMSGFLIACACLLILLVAAFLYIGKYERERAKNEEMLDKQELYRRLRADKWGRIQDGVTDWRDDL